MPTYFLLSEEAITGEVSAAYTCDKLIYGNVTLELWARPGPSFASREGGYKFITSYKIDNVRHRSAVGTIECFA